MAQHGPTAKFSPNLSFVILTATENTPPITPYSLCLLHRLLVPTCSYRQCQCKQKRAPRSVQFLVLTLGLNAKVSRMQEGYDQTQSKGLIQFRAVNLCPKLINSHRVQQSLCFVCLRLDRFRPKCGCLIIVVTVVAASSPQLHVWC